MIHSCHNQHTIKIVLTLIRVAFYNITLGTKMGYGPTRAKSNGLAIHCLKLMVLTPLLKSYQNRIISKKGTMLTAEAHVNQP